MDKIKENINKNKNKPRNTFQIGKKSEGMARFEAKGQAIRDMINTKLKLRV